jgi:hypothetical protein
MPGGGFIFSQAGFGQRLGQVTTRTGLLIVRHQPGNGRAILNQHKGDVLIMRAVDAIGKIARGVRDTDLSHKIRLSDFHPISTNSWERWRLAGQSEAGNRNSSAKRQRSQVAFEIAVTTGKIVLKSVPSLFGRQFRTDKKIRAGK